MSMSGGSYDQRIEHNGWGYVWCNSTGRVLINFYGLPSESAVTPFVENTSSLVRELGIDFFLVNPNTDYNTFLRLVHDAITGATTNKVFQEGEVYIFEVTFAGGTGS